MAARSSCSVVPWNFSAEQKGPLFRFVFDYMAVSPTLTDNHAASHCDYFIVKVVSCFFQCKAFNVKVEHNIANVASSVYFTRLFAI